MKVLVIDDSENVRRAFRYELESRFPEAALLVHASFEEALEDSALAEVGVAIVDFSIPGGMNGAEGTAAILEKFPAIKVIVNSFNTDVEEACLEAGASFFVGPPIFLNIQPPKKHLLQEDLIPLL